MNINDKSARNAKKGSKFLWWNLPGSPPPTVLICPSCQNLALQPLLRSQSNQHTSFHLMNISSLIGPVLWFDLEFKNVVWWKMVKSSQKDFVVFHILMQFSFSSSFKCKSPQCLIRLGTDWKNILYGIKASLWMQKRREQPSSSHLRFCRGYGDYEMGLLCEIMQTRQWITRLLFRLIGFHIKDFWKVFTLIFPYFTTSDMKCCLSNRLVYCRINVSLLEFWHVCVWSLGD